MIRYPFDAEMVSAAINEVDRKWLKKAVAHTKALIKANSFPSDYPSDWSKVKTVFMKLQQNKCIYCERQLANRDYGTIEWDLEHFRPKSKVACWPDHVRHRHLNYSFPTGPALPEGYYWLAYNLRNYASACKVCNSIFKHVFFPIAGDRGFVPTDPRGLLAEEPYLCLPLGDDDEDPENLIQFVVTTAMPAAADGHRLKRGQVIIDFFGLNIRDDLHRGRAQMIAVLGNALSNVSAGRGSTSDSKLLAQMAKPNTPHANCARSFKRLWSEDNSLARRALDLCLEFGFSEPGTAPPSL